METDREPSFREELLQEIQQEILSLEGSELDEYLIALGMDPNDLLESFNAVFQAPEIAAKRRKFANLNLPSAHWFYHSTRRRSVRSTLLSPKGSTSPAT
jgi:hypothetical protein